MKIIDNELEARAESEEPVSIIGELLAFRALIFTEADHGEGSYGFGEYNYDASIFIFEDKVAAQAAFDAAIVGLSAADVEEECLDCDNEAFIALYDTPWGFALLGGDSSGMGAAGGLVCEAAPGAVDIPHFTIDRMIYDMKLEDLRDQSAN